MLFSESSCWVEQSVPDLHVHLVKGLLQIYKVNRESESMTWLALFKRFYAKLERLKSDINVTWLGQNRRDKMEKNNATV